MSKENDKVINEESVQGENTNQDIKMNNKKILIGLVLALLIASIVLVVAISGGGEEMFSSISGTANNQAQGTWELVSVEENGEYVEGDDLLIAYGGAVIYDLKEEGELVITMIGQDFTGEWTQNGDTVELMYNGGGTTLEFHGDTMTMGDEEVTYTMKIK